MPVSPNIGQDYALEVAQVYRDAELRILQRIATNLRIGIESPDWEIQALARAQAVREQVVAELNRTNPAAAAAIRQAVGDAYDAGGAAAVRDVSGYLKGGTDITPPARVAAVSALVRDTTAGLDSVGPTILRQVDDIYRTTVQRAALTSASDAASRLVAAQEALQDLAGRGVTGIQTARGVWNMTDYLSMAVRTATARAAIAGTTQTMTSMDIDLVVVHPGPRACDICDDWARGILTIDPGGVAGEVTVDAVDGSGQVTVEVMGSLDDARGDGWGHPNCRCAIAAYLPGVTDASTIQRPEWDREGYEAQQQQRAIEREIRDAKTQEAIALSEQAERAAHEEVLRWQAEMRSHLARHEELKRQYSREQTGRVI